MRRWRRYIFFWLTALSLAMGAAVVGAYVVSFRKPLEVRFERRGERCRTAVERGTLVVDNRPQFDAWEATVRRLNLADHRLQEAELARAAARGPNEWAAGSSAVGRAWQAKAAVWEEVSSFRGTREWRWRRDARLPAALGVAMALVLPGARFVAWRRLKGRRRRGLCEQCGYDLRGNVSGVCPECGRRVGDEALQGR